MKKIIIASNPFGYGPTGQAIALVHELLKDKNSFDVHFIGSGLCLEIIKDEFKESGITVTELNERDEGSLRAYISNFSSKNIDTICVGMQNRFIVKIAKELDIKCIFVDGLGWFWSTVPESHLTADRVYWTNFPNLLAYDKNVPNNVVIIGLLQDSFNWNPDIKNSYYLVSLGGCTNPLRQGYQEYYLKLVLKVFSKVYLHTRIPIKIALGNSARLFLEDIETFPPGITVNTYNHRDMMFQLAGCMHHYSIGGQSSTMEALISKVPTTFFLPSNMSQVMFQRVFNKFCTGNYYVHWESFNTKFKELEGNDEAFIIDIIDQFSKEILSNERAISTLVEHCISGLNEQDENKMFHLIKELGIDGAEKIASDLLNIK